MGVGTLQHWTAAPELDLTEAVLTRDASRVSQPLAAIQVKGMGVH